jgi:methionine salvage enolase-phosphatase E1
MVLRSDNMRELESAAAERTKTKNANRIGTAPSVPRDMKPRNKDAAAA